jgi:hypothetical protein
MPKRHSVHGICELALRQIGAIPITESATQGPELDQAIYWLDLLVAHHVAVNRVLHLVPSTLALPISAGVKDYDITNTAAAAEPNNGVQFPIQASLRDPFGNDTPLSIVSRSEYEEIADKDSSGTPDRVYINRLDQPKMSVYPVLATASTPGYTIQLVVQAFSKDLTVSRGAQVTHEMRTAWQLWMVLALAIRLGSGPVRKLPKSEIDDLKAEATEMLKDLLLNENREHTGYPRVVDTTEF